MGKEVCLNSSFQPMLKARAKGYNLVYEQQKGTRLKGMRDGSMEKMREGPVGMVEGQYRWDL